MNNYQGSYLNDNSNIGSTYVNEPEPFFGSIQPSPKKSNSKKPMELSKPIIPVRLTIISGNTQRS